MKRLAVPALALAALFFTPAGCPRPDGYTAAPALSSACTNRTVSVLSLNSL